MHPSYRNMFNLLASSNQVYGTIFLCGNKVLLVKGRNSGKWSFPKGHAKQGETEFEAAKRETLEETGLVLNQFDRIVQLSTGTYYLVYTSFETACKVQDLKEVCATQWIPIDEIANLSVNIDVNAFLKTVYARPTKSYKPKYIVRQYLV
jgi:8-oxo-dGTP pyrophosphatase MutT (NUDIX family)